MAKPRPSATALTRGVTNAPPPPRHLKCTPPPRACHYLNYTTTGPLPPATTKSPTAPAPMFHLPTSPISSTTLQFSNHDYCFPPLPPGMIAKRPQRQRRQRRQHYNVAVVSGCKMWWGSLVHSFMVVEHSLKVELQSQCRVLLRKVISHFLRNLIIRQEMQFHV